MSASPQTVQDWLIEWLEERGVELPADRAALVATDYIADGQVDSVMMIELIAAIEAEFRAPLGRRHLADPRLTTVGGLADIVAEVTGWERPS